MEQKKKRKRRTSILRGMTSVFLALAVIAASALSVATKWSTKVNELLGISDGTVARSMNEEDYRYLSDYSEPGELIDAEVALNTRLEAEGAVLLKGNPAVEGQKVTLFGMRSDASAMQYGGSMGSKIADSECVGLAEAMGEYGFEVNPAMVEFYSGKLETNAPSRAAGGNCVDQAEGTTIGEVPVSEYTEAQTGTYHSYSDAAIIVLGRDAGESCCFYPGADGISNSAEFADSITGNILGLSDDERDLVHYVEEQGFGKVIVLLNSACTMEIEELRQDEQVDSILWIGNPGAYGTYGIAEILSGEVLPSGHLTDTYAVNTAVSPAVMNYGVYLFENADTIETTQNSANRCKWFLAEEESIYMGYKYYETRYYDAVLEQGNASYAAHGETAYGTHDWDYDKEVSYSFGYGMEGSQFSEMIVDSSIDWSGEEDSSITVRVTNVGDTAAKHVVQLYASLPYTDYDKTNGVEKSAIQLIGYAKTGEDKEKDYTETILLEPAESEDIMITFQAADLWTYDMTYDHDDTEGAYLLEAGEYYFATGNGAHDAVQSVIKAQNPNLLKEVTPSGTCIVEQIEETIAFTESNETLIENQLTDAELNSYDCGTEISYLTRNDWSESFPEGIRSVAATEEMIVLLHNQTYDSEAENAAYDGENSYSYDKKVEMLACELSGLAYDDPAYEQVLSEVSLQDMVNQFLAHTESLSSIVMPKNMGADSPLGIISQIGMYTDGTIYEVGESDPSFGHDTNVYVSENVVAATFSKELAAEQGKMIGNDALWTGNTGWNAPGLNIHRSPYNGRNIEYYSEDPVLTGTMGAMLIENVRDYGVVCFPKHFAFNDQETNRDGIAVFLNEQAARENELRGFQIALRDNNSPGLMTAFNRVGCTHASASKGLLQGILRGEWGYDGYVISDSVKSAQYFQPSECLMAGTDQMLGAANNGEVWNYSAETVGADPVLENGVRESFHRYLYTFGNSNVMNGITADTSAAGSAPWWQTALVIVVCAFSLLTAAFGVLWGITGWREKKSACQIVVEKKKAE